MRGVGKRHIGHLRPFQLRALRQPRGFHLNDVVAIIDHAYFQLEFAFGMLQLAQLNIVLTALRWESLDQVVAVAIVHEHFHATLPVLELEGSLERESGASGKDFLRFRVLSIIVVGVGHSDRLGIPVLDVDRLTTIFRAQDGSLETGASGKALHSVYGSEQLLVAEHLSDDLLHCGGPGSVAD